MTRYSVGMKTSLGWLVTRPDKINAVASCADEADAHAIVAALNATVHRMNFGGALDHLKRGFRVRRAGWNGKGMWLLFVNTRRDAQTSVAGETLIELPWIGMRTADGAWVPWLAPQTDLLADDWEVAT